MLVLGSNGILVFVSDKTKMPAAPPSHVRVPSSETRPPRAAPSPPPRPGVRNHHSKKIIMS